MLDRHAALRRVLYLKPLPEPVITEIAAAGRACVFSRGEVLFQEGERCRGLLVVLAGTVKVYKTDARGRELTLGVERPGGSIGDLPLFDGGSYPATAEAVEDATTVLVVPRDRFQALMAVHPQIPQEAVRALAVQVRKLTEMLKAQTLHTVRSRLAEYLLQAAGEEITFPLRDTNDAIGSQVGTVREVVSRTLHAFKDAGAITLQGRTVTIRDRDVLRRLAQRDAP